MDDEVYKKADKKITNMNFMNTRIGTGVAHCTKVDTDSFCLDLEFMLMMMAPVENCLNIFKPSICLNAGSIARATVLPSILGGTAA